MKTFKCSNCRNSSLILDIGICLSCYMLVKPEVKNESGKI